MDNSMERGILEKLGKGLKVAYGLESPGDSPDPSSD